MRRILGKRSGIDDYLDFAVKSQQIPAIGSVPELRGISSTVLKRIIDNLPLAIPQQRFMCQPLGYYTLGPPEQLGQYTIGCQLNISNRLFKF